MTIAEIYSIYKKHSVVCTDTRAISKGCIFFALKGANFNGNTFAATAIEQGAAYCVIDEAAFKKDERFIVVDDVLSALQQLANYHRRQLSARVVAITGSNGKTTTKELMNKVLSKKYKTYATRGNLNNHIGVPLTLLAMSDDTEMAIVEMGANHQQEIKMLCEIAEPDFGIITNVGKAHTEGFGGFEGVKKGKGEMYEYLAKKNGTVFINAMSAHLAQMCATAAVRKRVAYGSENDNENNGNVMPDCAGTLIETSPFLEVTWTYGDTTCVVSTKLIGEYNFENILAAACIGHYFDVPAEAIRTAIAEYVPDNSRSQVIQKGSNTIVLDAYNANPSSMTAALKNFASMKGENKIVFLGDMAELGAESAQEHEAIVDMLGELKSTEVVLVGKKFGEFALKISCHHFENSESAAAFAKERKFENTTILIKGSRSSRMEKVMEAL